jgi:hypothetical protein
VGVIAARNPESGDFLPSVPIFREESPSTAPNASFGVQRFEKIIAEKMKQYIDTQRELNPKPKKKEGISRCT